MSICTTTGQLVKYVSGLNTKVDVSALSSGLYIVKIQSGFSRFIEKIIIK
ncbi:T9SS type A sorting domain-containing protein [Mariniflexile sp.]